MIGATRGPSDSAVGRAREPEGHGFTEISEAGEVGRVAIRAEGDAGIATEVIGAGPRHGGVVRELGDARDEAAGQGRRPRLAAIKGGVDAAAVVVVPVVVAGDHVARVRRIDGQRSFVLCRGIAADVDHRYRAGAEGAEAGGAECGNGGFAAGGEEYPGDGERRETWRVTHVQLQRESRAVE